MSWNPFKDSWGMTDKVKNAWDSTWDFVESTYKSFEGFYVDAARGLGRGFRGNWDEAWKDFGQSGANFMDVLTYGSYSASSKGEVGNLMSSSDLNKYTLGTGENLYHSSLGVRNMQETGEMTGEQWKHSGILAGKVGAVVTGGALASGGMSASAGYAAKTAALGGLQQDLYNWGAPEAAALVGMYGQTLQAPPGNWITDLLGGIGAALEGSLESPVIREYNPYSYEGSMDSGMSGGGKSIAIPIVASIAILGLGILILRKK